MEPQSIAANSATALLGRAAHVALGIIITAAVTRLLGVSLFGQYTTLLAVCSLIVTGADFGLYLSFTRAIGEDRKHTPRLLSDIIWLRLILLLGLFTLGSFTTQFIPAVANLTGVFWLAALGFIAQSFSQLFMGIFQTYSVVWRATIGDLTGRLAQLALILIIGTLSITHTSLATMIGAATLGALVSFGIHRFLVPISWRLQAAPNWTQAKTLLKDAWPLALLLLLNVIYFRIDMVILSLFRSPTEVGLYGLAYRMIESALFIPAMFGGLLLPRLSSSKTALPTLLTESFAALLWAGTGLSLITTLLALPGINFLSGQQYLAAAPLLQILALALAVMFLGNLFGFTLVARKQQRSLLKLYGFLVVGNIILNLWAIPRFGALAAAWTTVITEAAATLVAGYLTWKNIPFTVSASFVARLIFVLGITAIATRMLPTDWHVIIQGVISISIFAGVSWLCGLITPTKFQSLLARP